MSTTALGPEVKETEIPCNQRMKIHIKQKQAGVSLYIIYEYTSYLSFTSACNKSKILCSTEFKFCIFIAM